MITVKHYLALLGFLFVAAWIGFDFGRAVLCLVGAVIFYLIGEVLQGELDLGEMQARVRRSTQSSR
jgi:large-conductance mechanosensitive channel